MGFSYSINPRTGRQSLACDFCGTSGGVRKIRCPYGYCQAWATCPACRKAKKHNVSSVGVVKADGTPAGDEVVRKHEHCKVAMTRTEPPRFYARAFGEAVARPLEDVLARGGAGVVIAGNTTRDKYIETLRIISPSQPEAWYEGQARMQAARRPFANA